MSLFTRPRFEDRQIVQYSGTSINLSGETYINNIGYLQINAPILDFTGTTSASTLYTLAGVSGYVNEGLVSSFIVQPPIILQSGATGTTSVNVTGYYLGGLDSGGTVTWLPPFTGTTSGNCLSDVCIKGILTILNDILIKWIRAGAGKGDYVTNTVFGKDTLNSNISGEYNTGFGSETLVYNTTGDRNTAVGTYALKYNTTADFNTALGNSSLGATTTGGGNTAVGSGSLNSNTIGYANTAIGYNSMVSNTVGDTNTGLGIYALHDNVSGYENVSAGHYSLFQNTTGYQNTGIGNQSITSNTTGYINTGIGYAALSSNTIGLGNTSIGYGSGLSNTTGNYNTFLGNSSDCITTNLTNATAVGYNAIVNQSNSMVLGNGLINVGIGISTPTSTLHLIGLNGFSQLRLGTQYTPTSTLDTNGNLGDTAWDDNFIYIKTSVGWKRSGLSTF